MNIPELTLTEQSKFQGVNPIAGMGVGIEFAVNT